MNRRLALCISILTLLWTPLLHGQTHGVASEPNDPPQTPVSRDPPLNPALPTVFIVGDSTARNGVDLGWGDHFAALFDTTRVNIANRAKFARSTRTYITDGSWDFDLAQMKPGDFVLIQLGQNDSGAFGGTHLPRGTIKGIGNDSQDVAQADGHIETIHTYGWYLRKYITDTRAKGATPTLLTLTIRNIWADNHVQRDIGYNGFIRQVGAAEKVPVADMGALIADKYDSLGATAVAAYFPKGNTHTSPEGAALNAEAVALALKKVQSPIANYLKP